MLACTDLVCVTKRVRKARQILKGSTFIANGTCEEKGEDNQESNLGYTAQDHTHEKLLLEVVPVMVTTITTIRLEEGRGVHRLSAT